MITLIGLGAILLGLILVIAAAVLIAWLDEKNILGPICVGLMVGFLVWAAFDASHEVGVAVLGWL